MLKKKTSKTPTNVSITMDTTAAKLSSTETKNNLVDAQFDKIEKNKIYKYVNTRCCVDMFCMFKRYQIHTYVEMRTCHATANI